MKYSNPTVLNATDNASQTSAALDASQVYQASFVAAVSATAAGSYKIQMSNDPDVSGQYTTAFTPTNWVDIPNTSTTITAATPIAPIILSTVSARWLRVVYTHASGGTGNILVNMFTIGA